MQNATTFPSSNLMTGPLKSFLSNIGQAHSASHPGLWCIVGPSGPWCISVSGEREAWMKRSTFLKSQLLEDLYVCNMCVWGGEGKCKFL